MTLAFDAPGLGRHPREAFAGGIRTIHREGVYVLRNAARVRRAGVVWPDCVVSFNMAQHMSEGSRCDDGERRIETLAES